MPFAGQTHVGLWNLVLAGDRKNPQKGQFHEGFAEYHIRMSAEVVATAKMGLRRCGFPSTYFDHMLWKRAGFFGSAVVAVTNEFRVTDGSSFHSSRRRVAAAAVCMLQDSHPSLTDSLHRCPSLHTSSPYLQHFHHRSVSVQQPQPHSIYWCIALS